MRFCSAVLSLFIIKHFALPIPTVFITNFITFMFPSLPPISCSKSNYVPHINKIKSSDMTSSIHTLTYLTHLYTTPKISEYSIRCPLFSELIPQTAILDLIFLHSKTLFYELFPDSPIVNFTNS